MIGDFIAFDLETTGLDREKDQIIEIGLVRYKEGVEESTYRTLIKPVDLVVKSTEDGLKLESVEVRDFISKLTGISNESLKEAPIFADVASDIIEFCENLPMVAHNAPFDEHFLLKAYEGYNKKLEDELKLNWPSVPFYDTLVLSRLAWFLAPNHKLGTLKEFLNIDVSGDAHSAIPDSRVCGEIFLAGQAELCQWKKPLLGQIGLFVEGSCWEELFKSFEENEIKADALIHKFFREPVVEQEKIKKVKEGAIGDSISWDTIFSKKSDLQKSLPEFEVRKGQEDLYRKTYNSLSKGGLLLAEAPSGSGKTLAYSGAIIRQCLQTGERILISTATKALQYQLSKKDLPVWVSLLQSLPGLSGVAAKKLKVASLKGRDSYLCPRRLIALVKEPSRVLNLQERLGLMPVLPWAAYTQTGDISELTGFHAHRMPHLWQRVNGAGRFCNKAKCNGFECYADKARSEANKAQVLVVNHALLVSDLKLDRAILPFWDKLVVDEAHRLPSFVSSGTGEKLWFYRLRQALQTLVHPYSKDLSPMQIYARKYPEHEEVCSRIEMNAKAFEKGLHKMFLKLAKELRKKKAKNPFVFEGGLNAHFELSIGDWNHKADELCSSVSELEARLRELSSEEANYCAELLAFNQSVEEIKHSMRAFAEGDSNQFNWVEEWGNPHHLKLISEAKTPGVWLKEKLFNNLQGGALLSASLECEKTSTWMPKQLGVNELKRPKVFYHTQEVNEKMWEGSQIAISTQLPAPGKPGWETAILNYLCKWVPKLEGSTLVLFTSVDLLMKAHTRLAKVFAKTDRSLFAQHVDGNIEGLIEMFKGCPGSVLLGTQVFWEGLDLPGKELENLVFTRLPFPNPNRAYLQAQSKMLEAAGGNPFNEIHMPIALMDMKQGLGRLLRTPEDKGKVLILDGRVESAPYGKKFKNLWNIEHSVVESSEQMEVFCESEL